MDRFIWYDTNLIIEHSCAQLSKPYDMMRRLNNQDVNGIFDAVFNNTIPKVRDDLQFHIVVVGPECNRLSPPSYEFEDGLYLLLKPLQKGRTPSAQDPRVPSNLRGFVVDTFPDNECRWSLSGPQFPLPTGIQQRYCYPRGCHEYSSKKGGALWTVYDEDGKENLDYRLLHVYHSIKRASTPRLAPKKRGKQMSDDQRGRKKQRRGSAVSYTRTTMARRHPDTDYILPTPLLPTTSLPPGLPVELSAPYYPTPQLCSRAAEDTPRHPYTMTAAYSKMNDALQSTPPYELTPPSPCPHGGQLCPSIFSLSDDSTNKDLDSFITPDQERANVLPVLPFSNSEFLQSDTTTASNKSNTEITLESFPDVDHSSVNASTSKAHTNFASSDNEISRQGQLKRLHSGDSHSTQHYIRHDRHDPDVYPRLPFRSQRFSLRSAQSYPPQPAMVNHHNHHCITLDMSLDIEAKNYERLNRFAECLQKTQESILHSLSNQPSPCIQQDMVQMVTQWAKKYSQNPMGPILKFKLAQPLDGKMSCEVRGGEDGVLNAERESNATDDETKSEGDVKEAVMDSDIDVPSPPSIVRSDKAQEVVSGVEEDSMEPLPL